MAQHEAAYLMNKYHSLDADLLRLYWCFFFFFPSGKKEQLWMDLNAGAESGWDFTSRWYTADGGDNSGTLRDTRTSQILPADLNALLCRNEKTLASFHRLLGEPF